MKIELEGHGISVKTQRSEHGNYDVYLAVCKCGKYQSLSHITTIEAEQAGLAHMISMKRRMKAAQ